MLFKNFDLSNLNVNEVGTGLLVRLHHDDKIIKDLCKQAAKAMKSKA